MLFFAKQHLHPHTCCRWEIVGRLSTAPELLGNELGIPGYWAVFFLRAGIPNPAEYLDDLPTDVANMIAFR